VVGRSPSLIIAVLHRTFFLSNATDRKLKRVIVERLATLWLHDHRRTKLQASPKIPRNGIPSCAIASRTFRCRRAYSASEKRGNSSLPVKRSPTATPLPAEECDRIKSQSLQAHNLFRFSPH